MPLKPPGVPVTAQLLLKLDKRRAPLAPCCTTTAGNRTRKACLICGTATLTAPSHLMGPETCSSTTHPAILLLPGGSQSHYGWKSPSTPPAPSIPLHWPPELHPERLLWPLRGSGHALTARPDNRILPRRPREAPSSPMAKKVSLSTAAASLQSNSSDAASARLRRLGSLCGRASRRSCSARDVMARPLPSADT